VRDSLCAVMDRHSQWYGCLCQADSRKVARRERPCYYRSVFPHFLVLRKKEQVATKPTNIQ
jgi:hypothetical protein